MRLTLRYALCIISPDEQEPTMPTNLEQLTATAPFKVVTTCDDGSEAIASALSREAADRLFAQRNQLIGHTDRFGRTVVNVELRVA